VLRISEVRPLRGGRTARIFCVTGSVSTGFFQGGIRRRDGRYRGKEIKKLWDGTLRLRCNCGEEPRGEEGKNNEERAREYFRFNGEKRRVPGA